MKKIIFYILIIPFLFGCSTPDFHINFVLDKTRDRIQIFYMLRPNDPGGWTNRARFMGIDYDFAKMIQESKNYIKVNSSLKNLVNERYQEIGNGLINSVNDYSAAWEPCIKEFSDVVTELTQHDWYYKSYTCVVSGFHYGISNWHGNKIMRHYGENPVEQRYITAWEIVLSHTFHISRKYFNKKEAPDHIIWAISEITAWLVLEDERLIKLWGDNFVQPASTGYNQLNELEIKLRTAYTGKADFKDYLKTAIQIAKEMDMDFFKPVESKHVEPDASFWLLTSIPEDFNIQPTPTAIGWGIIVNNSLSVDLVEPFNYQNRGWWTFSNTSWSDKGEYYILYVPMKWADDFSSFTWMFNEAQIYVGDDINPLKIEIESANICFSFDQFKKLY